MHALQVRNFPFITRLRRVVMWSFGGGFMGGKGGARARGTVWGLASWGLVGGVDAGLHGFCVSGWVHCRVAAFQVFAHLVLADFFITISHCAWRRVISWSLATKKTKQRKRFHLSKN